MKASLAERGAVAGSRWARNFASTHEVRNFLSVLDRMFEEEVWDYRIFYTSIAQIPCLAAGDAATPIEDVRTQPESSVLHWWREAAGMHWPDDAEDRPDFVKGFVIGAALEIREGLFS